MKLAMLRVSVPVLVMMLLQINPVEGMITRDQATEIFFLAKTDLSAASNKLIACAAEKNQEAIYAILDNYLPNAYKKDAETQDKIKSEILTSFLGLSEADTTVAGVNEALKNLFISKLFEAYWTRNDQIYNDIESWLQEIKDGWGDNEAENRAIFERTIIEGVQIEDDPQIQQQQAGFTVEDYFNEVNAYQDSDERYAAARTSLLVNRMNIACDSYDLGEIKRFLKISLQRDIDNDKNAYTQMIDDIIAEQPTAQDDDPLSLDNVTYKIFGRHFVDYVNFSGYVPPKNENNFDNWYGLIRSLDEAATDPSKREAAIHDLFTPISEQDANELIANLKLIKEKTK